ncbi:MAG TPA: carbonic anhydrase [Ktedonobacterales bacterium]
MATGVFATAITCIDGRTQTPVSEWIKQNANAEYVDTVTWPGPDGALTAPNQSALAQIRAAVEISVRAHGSSFVSVAGHYDCAAFPAERDRRLAAIRDAVNIVASWDLPVRVTGLYVNDQWQIEVVAYGGAS